MKIQANVNYVQLMNNLMDISAMRQIAAIDSS